MASSEPTREEWLKTIADAKAQLRRAKTDYEQALRMGYRSGVSFTALASAAGVSEAAIRLQFKRRGWD